MKRTLPLLQSNGLIHVIDTRDPPIWCVFLSMTNRAILWGLLSHNAIPFTFLGRYPGDKVSGGYDLGRYSLGLLYVLLQINQFCYSETLLIWTTAFCHYDPSSDIRLRHSRLRSRGEELDFAVTVTASEPRHCHLHFHQCMENQKPAYHYLISISISVITSLALGVHSVLPPPRFLALSQFLSATRPCLS